MWLEEDYKLLKYFGSGNEAYKICMIVWHYHMQIKHTSSSLMPAVFKNSSNHQRDRNKFRWEKGSSYNEQVILLRGKSMCI